MSLHDIIMLIDDIDLRYLNTLYLVGGPMADEAFYPLYIFALSDDERCLIIEILHEGMKHGVFQRNELEATSGHKLRHLIGTKDQDLKKRFGVRKKSSERFSDESWVFLYSYVMGKFRIICEVRELHELMKKIDKLYRTGLESGRYDKDMHLFNRDHMSLDSRSSPFDERYQDDVYVGFRYRSDGSAVVICATRIRREKERHVFVSRTMTDIADRQTQGIAYQVGGFIYLFGFFNDNVGGEFCALRPEGRQHEILFGTISTTNKDGIPHTKQCCFVKMGSLYGTEKLSKSMPLFGRPFDTLRETIEHFYDGKVGLILREGQRMELTRYISPTSLFAKNTGETVQTTGPAH